MQIGINCNQSQQENLFFQKLHKSGLTPSELIELQGEFLRTTLDFWQLTP